MRLPEGGRRGLVGLAALIGGLLIILLIGDSHLFGRVRVSLDAESTGVRLRLARRPATLEWQPVRSVIVRDVRTVADLRTGEALEDLSGDVQFVTREANGDAAPALTIGSTILPSATEISVQSRVEADEWDIDLMLPAVEDAVLRLSAPQPVAIMDAADERRVPSPASLETRPRGKAIALIVPSQAQELLSVVEISSLAFLKRSGARTEQGDDRRDAPSLLRASIQLPDHRVPSRQVERAAPTALDLRNAEGTASLRLGQGRIHLRFDGYVDGITEQGVSLVPSLPERILASSTATWMKIFVQVLGGLGAAWGGVKAIREYRRSTTKEPWSCP